MLVELGKLAKEYNVEVNFWYDYANKRFVLIVYDRGTKFHSRHYIPENDLCCHGYAEDFIMAFIRQRIEENRNFCTSWSQKDIFEAAKVAGCDIDGDYVYVNGYKFYVNAMENIVIGPIGDVIKEEAFNWDGNSLNARKHMVKMADEKKVEG
ncbi:hypothetical protein LG34_06140 [Eubacterium ramulus]|uniref:Uncharacterized protein n=1 Tax=Eubacterium ramulus TaxID=39490 RepID=A0A2V1JX49_EUBRA|nr:hypothetical protein [Eubacterium ramulus]PWE87108.1 hypothetical protein LG34_06140 [Eubacterium ramulus]